MPKYTRFQLAINDTSSPGSAKIDSVDEWGMHIRYADGQIGLVFDTNLPGKHLPFDEKIEVPLLDLKFVGKPAASLPVHVKRMIAQYYHPDAGNQILNGTIVGASPFDYKVQCLDGKTRYISREVITGKTYESLYM